LGRRGWYQLHPSPSCSPGNGIEVRLDLGQSTHQIHIMAPSGPVDRTVNLRLYEPARRRRVLSGSGFFKVAGPRPAVPVLRAWTSTRGTALDRCSVVLQPTNRLRSEGKVCCWEARFRKSSWTLCPESSGLAVVGLPQSNCAGKERKVAAIGMVIRAHKTLGCDGGSPRAYFPEPDGEL